MTHLKRLLLRHRLLNEFEGSGSTAGGAIDTPSATPAPAPVESPAASPAPAAPAAPAAAPAPTGPTTMLEAITQGLAQPRDEFGRFAPKTAAELAADAAKAATPAAAPAATPAQPAAAKPAEPKPGAVTTEDLTPPEGLTPQAQQRFQKLANANREQAAQIESLAAKHEEQVGYLRDTFQQNGIRAEQFEQAASLIGLLNRGDVAGYQKALTQELQRVSLMTGQATQVVDALSSFPDLREKVNGLQISEADAVEIARQRQVLGQQQQARQAQQRTQQESQERTESVKAATKAVDDVCKQLQSSDMDYAAIEDQLLPRLGALLKGVPPEHWADHFKTQYQFAKETLSSARRGAPITPANVLRPTGQGSPGAAPKTMFEAMWNRPQA
jgi:hypothetical protein